MENSATAERELYQLAHAVMAGSVDEVARAFAQTFPSDAGEAEPPAAVGVPEFVLPKINDDMPVGCQTLCAAFLRHYENLGWAPNTSWELGADPGLGGWVAIASGKGLIHLDDRLLAFTVLNPRAYYPLHKHTPEEIYITVSGGFWLHHQGLEPVWVGPGDTVFNASNQPHALTGGGESTLIIACWRDGSFEPSIILE